MCIVYVLLTIDWAFVGNYSFLSLEIWISGENVVKLNLKHTSYMLADSSVISMVKNTIRGQSSYVHESYSILIVTYILIDFAIVFIGPTTIAAFALTIFQFLTSIKYMRIK